MAGGKISPAVAAIIIIVVVAIAGVLIWRFTEHSEHKMTAQEWQQITAKAGAAEAQQPKSTGSQQPGATGTQQPAGVAAHHK